MLEQKFTALNESLDTFESLPITIIHPNRFKDIPERQQINPILESMHGSDL